MIIRDMQIFCAHRGGQDNGVKKMKCGKEDERKLTYTIMQRMFGIYERLWNDVLKSPTLDAEREVALQHGIDPPHE